jgi:hypothetical protein
MKKYNYSSNEKIFTQKIHTSCSYNNMKTYTISKKKQKKKNFKCIFKLEYEVFFALKMTLLEKTEIRNSELPSEVFFLLILRLQS